MTHSELAGEEGKSGDAERYSDEASSIIEEWSGLLQSVDNIANLSVGRRFLNTC